MNRTALWTAYATLYVERFGLSVIPLLDDKKPARPWAKFQDERPKLSDIVSWASDPNVCNLGIVTGQISNLCVIDCDSRPSAEWFHTTHGGSPVMVRTKRGVHFYFRHPDERVQNASGIESGGHSYDVRGDGGFVVAPPSLHSEGEYQWVKPLIWPADLPRFNTDWRPQRAGQAQSEKKIHDGIKYIAHIRAVQGQRGSDDTYRACCILRESGLSEGESLLAMQEWNAAGNADPPWSDRELLHKVTSAYAC
jgi:hypothetical protein